jgi:hypothetical protein
MPNTTNFNWATPADTDLVKDGASAIRTLGNSIDTSFVDLKGGTTGQVLAKASNTDLDFVWSADAAGMNNPMTTTGDTIYSSSGSTPARLGIGSTGQVLTVAGGVPTWGAAPSSSQNWTLVNTGGTAMSGSSGITVSGITGADKLMVCILQASSTSGALKVGIRINNDSTANRYNHMGCALDVKATYSVDGFEIFSDGNGAENNKISVGTFSSSASSQMTSTVFINGGNSAGVKPFQINTGVKNSGSANAKNVFAGGWYNEASTISSIRVICEDDTVNFDSGTLYVFKSA